MPDTAACRVDSGKPTLCQLDRRLAEAVSPHSLIASRHSFSRSSTFVPAALLPNTMRTALVAALLPAAALAQSYSLFRNHQGATFFDGLDFVSG